MPSPLHPLGHSTVLLHHSPLIHHPGIVLRALPACHAVPSQGKHKSFLQTFTTSTSDSCSLLLTNECKLHLCALPSPLLCTLREMDSAHPCSLVNATINGCSHLGKDKPFNRRPPCGYPCPSCRTLSAAAFSPNQQQYHCSTPTALTYSSVSSTSAHLEPMVYPFFGQKTLPNYPHLSFHCVTNSIVEGVECPRTSPCALSIKSLGWLCNYLLTKASPTTLGYLAQSLTLGHSTALFPVSASTLQKVGGETAKHCRAPKTLQHLPHPPAPPSRSGIWLYQIPSCLRCSCFKPFLSL